MNALRLWSGGDEVRMWLLCLPPGGGAARQFRSWPGRLPPALGVAAVEYPGHGSRSDEPPASGAGVLVAELARDVVPLLGRPVVLFGHSMGAILALDLARALRTERGWRPAALVAAASEPPDRPLVPAGATASDEELTALLRAWGGTSDELLADGGYLAETLPVIRADLALMAGRAHGDEPPLDCPVHTYLGEGDASVDAAKAREGWARQTRAGHTARAFPGGHFFFQESADRVLAALIDDANAAVGGRLQGVTHG